MTTNAAIIKTQELFDLPRDLFSHELDLLRAVRVAQQKCTVTKGDAVAFFGDQTPTYHATAWDASQIEAQELTAALGRYMEADKRHRDAMESAT